MKILYKHEKIRYLLVGIAANIIHFVIYYFLIETFDYSNANSKKHSYLIVLFFSFFMHKSFSFKVVNTKLKTILLFTIIYILSFFINTYSHDLLDKNNDSYIPFFVSLSITVIFNYCSLKYIVFNKAK